MFYANILGEMNTNNTQETKYLYSYRIFHENRQENAAIFLKLIIVLRWYFHFYRWNFLKNLRKPGYHKHGFAVTQIGFRHI